MLTGLGAQVPLRESVVYYVHHVPILLSLSDQDVLRFEISMEEVFRVELLKSIEELEAQLEYSSDCELAFAELE